jgi:hypothetical protein
MGLLGPVVANALNDLQPSVAACFDEDAQARHGQAPVSRTAESPSAEEPGPTLLVLNLELSEGQIRIADAPVLNQGLASDGLVACAQRVLRGHVVHTSLVKAPGRSRVTFPLAQ